MSGLEVGGVALGAIPILLEAIKAYREAYNYLQSFKHAKKQLHLIRAQFQVCRLNFLNECQLLLHLILFDSQLSKEMIADPQHPRWHESAFQHQLKDLVKENADACTTIISDTCQTIQNFISRLGKLQSSGSEGQSSLRRARASATFMVEKGRFERDIDLLRRRNADLSLLRDQITSLGHRTRNTLVSSMSGTASTVVKRFAQIQGASRHLHETLKSSWSCFDQAHYRHSVKLSVDPGFPPDDSPESVSLDIAISSETLPQSAKANSPVWLLVRSENTKLNSTAFDPLESLVKSLQLSVSPPASSMTTAAQVSTTPSKPATSMATISVQASQVVDICTVACVCSHFEKNVQALQGRKQLQCLGYLKSGNDARYLFFPLPNPRTAIHSANTVHEVTTLISLIEKSRRSSLELLHQYQLALKIATSVLQFHDTAWLSSFWGLDKISIFGSKLSDDTLKSLHLSTHFEGPPATGSSQQIQSNSTPNVSNTTTPGVSLASSNNFCCPTIYNETLFSLGIALLEIAHWQPFQTLTDNDPDKVRAAHRLVRGPAPLGPKFQKIVQRCIRCDFESDTEDLEDVSLQYAVWSKAVYPLESLIDNTSQIV